MTTIRLTGTSRLIRPQPYACAEPAAAFVVHFDHPATFELEVIEDLGPHPDAVENHQRWALGGLQNSYLVALAILSRAWPDRRGGRFRDEHWDYTTPPRREPDVVYRGAAVWDVSP